MLIDEFWFFEPTYEYEGDNVTKIFFISETNSVENVKSINARMFQVNAHILSADLSQMSAVQKLFFFNAFIAKTQTYDLKPRDKFCKDHIYDIVGVFVNRVSVCAAMAKAYKYICDAFGINCIYAIGDAGGEHAWNLVQVGQFFYHVDPTWNMEDHWNSEYLGLDDRLMFRMEHKFYHKEYVYPKCESMAANYFQVLRRRVFRSQASPQQQFNDMVAVKLVSAGSANDKVGVFFDVSKKPLSCVDADETMLVVGFNTGVDFELELVDNWGDQLLNFAVELRGRLLFDWPSPASVRFDQRYVVKQQEDAFLEEVEKLAKSQRLSYEYVARAGMVRFQLKRK